jgi:glycosidase
MLNRQMPLAEFRVSRSARERYRVAETPVTPRGRVVLANMRAARQFAQQMNRTRDLARYPEQAVRAGQLHAMGLIDEILHMVEGLYARQRNPQVMARALAAVETAVGPTAMEGLLRRFADQFPPTPVYRREMDMDAYLLGETDGTPNRERLLSDMLHLWLANANPAFDPFRELFDDADFAHGTDYTRALAALRTFFDAQPPFGPRANPLPAMLREPVEASPHSLTGQLEYIRTHWMAMLGDYLLRLLAGMDILQEEDKPIFHGPGPSVVYDYTGLEDEPERFSMDKDWMPRVVLMAKNTYVWLDQLTKEYGRPITRLDEVPDAELDKLGRWGFTCLWLIGLWQRSGASKRVKEMMGNPDAVASAYSVYDYAPADDLGGEAALESLRARAWQRGIRLASDMVPNHVGIDAKWVVEHPDWFVGLDYSPFPSYSFNGPNLSWDSRVGIYLEDHYFNHSDAAVVFKRVDHQTGSERYIYHGNDGTSMPWNDTAQLNYLNHEVREAVIQTILHVARNFPVIRFDAAMTLAKKHYQRLWFPEPGTGGAIPSRAEHGMTKAQFNAVFPEEFWREVVDRVAAEAPDTLLLAEAFWLMEGYFVRTLGMHRVYNSAFMNMLRDEDNAKYRSVMKNTMEFDPQIMKRYVNFMNNPDERTAVEQYGTGDKYFGICMVMATLPGLPMFGHGQIEGFAEKYGMEYRRAYWDERANAGLVERHEREVFPVLQRRHVFADASDFLLYDFFAPEGHVNEDVYAYSNQCGNEHGLVVFHNKYAEASGWIKTSSAYAAKGPDGEKGLRQRSLGEGLGLSGDPACYVIFRDMVSGHEYLRNSRDLCERGLFVQLHGYQYHVFMDIREVRDEVGLYANLCGYLNGRGVPSIEQAMRELFLQPAHVAVRALVNADIIARLTRGEADEPWLDTLTEDAREAYAQASGFALGEGDPAAVAADLRATVERALATLEPSDDPATWGVLWAWLALRGLGPVVAPEAPILTARALVDEWTLTRLVEDALRGAGLDAAGAAWHATLVRALVAHEDWAATYAEAPLADMVEGWLQDEDVRKLWGINRHRDVLWFNGESLNVWLTWLERLAVLTDTDATRLADIRRAAETAEYRVEHLLAGVEETPA